nr:MAG TPA: hypothetical protein [Caudoviricetes sp.]
MRLLNSNYHLRRNAARGWTTTHARRTTYTSARCYCSSRTRSNYSRCACASGWSR